MRLTLESFDGPLDLLLYLIKSQELNIFNIPIIQITKQFLSFLHQATTLDFDKAGEYLAISAQLIEIKANILIPTLQNNTSDDPKSLEDLSDSDPRKPLVQQLLEYEAIKAACMTLEALPQLGRDSFHSGDYSRRKEEWEKLPSPIAGDAFSLAIAFEKVLIAFSKADHKPRIKIHSQKITIQDKMIWFKKKMLPGKNYLFSNILVSCENRYEIIISFMALLEMIKLNQLEVTQQELFGEINISMGSCFHEELPFLDPQKSENSLSQEAFI